MKKHIIAKHCWSTLVNAFWKGSDGIKMNLLSRRNGVRQTSYNSARTRVIFYMLVGITDCPNKVESDTKDLWITMCHQPNANHFILLRKKKRMSYGDVRMGVPYAKCVKSSSYSTCCWKPQPESCAWISALNSTEDVEQPKQEDCWKSVKRKLVRGSLVWGNLGWKGRGLGKWEWSQIRKEEKRNCFPDAVDQ